MIKTKVINLFGSSKTLEYELFHTITSTRKKDVAEERSLKYLSNSKDKFSTQIFDYRSSQFVLIKERFSN